MAQNVHVPKFGNWDSDGNVPYTQYFDNARKGKTGGRLINPNDPDENPDAFSKDVPPVDSPAFRSDLDQEIPKLKDDHRKREDGDLPQVTDLPLRPDSRKPSTDAPHNRSGDRTNFGDYQRRTGRNSAETDRSVEQSPLHPHHHAKSANKGGVSSPSWERKGSSEGGHGPAPQTPGRSRMRPSRGDESFDKGSALPKFGEWDESNPSSADGYTHIFDKVRQEKQTAAAKVPNISSDTQYNGHPRNSKSESQGCCGCFSWK